MLHRSCNIHRTRVAAHTSTDCLQVNHAAHVPQLDRKLCCVRAVNVHLIGERAKRARHSQVCSIENRGYIYYYCYYIYIMVRANFVLITRKEGGA